MSVETDLAYLMRQLASFPGRSPARVELSQGDGHIVAQLMADGLPRSLVGIGADTPRALRMLAAEIEQAIKDAERRARRRELARQRRARRR